MLVNTIVFMMLPGAPAGGELLRAARRRAGLTQAELAARAGVPRTMISAYERGVRDATLPTLGRMVRAAGFELEVRLVRARPAETDLAHLEAQFGPIEQEAWEALERTVATRDEEGTRRGRPPASKERRRQEGR